MPLPLSPVTPGGATTVSNSSPATSAANVSMHERSAQLENEVEALRETLRQRQQASANAAAQRQAESNKGGWFR